MFERRIARRIVGPVCEDAVWRGRRNHEIDGFFLENENFVKFIKSGRIRLIGHLTRMEDERTVKCTWKEKLYNRQWKGRPRNRCGR